MNTNLYFRLTLALVSIVGSLWLTTHMPSGSAFTPSVQAPNFDLWHGAFAVSCLMLSLIMARLLARS